MFLTFLTLALASCGGGEDPSTPSEGEENSQTGTNNAATPGATVTLLNPSVTVMMKSSRAEEMLGEEGYNLFNNNCEHFAAWCKTGEKHSKQIDRIGLVSGAGAVAVTTAARLAPLAALMGVVNVGLGLYTAMEVRRQGATIGRIEDRLDSTYELLSRQYGLLCSIEDTLGRQEKQLDDLLFAMLEGFDSIEDRIQGVTSARREDEYNRLIAALRRARLDVLDDLEHGDAVDARALDKLEAAADALLVWADGHLLMQNLHLMARQGLILTHIDAMLTTVDVLMLRNAKRNRRKSLRRVDRLRERIREEVVRLHEGATPWEVLTVIADQVSAYGQVYALLGGRQNSPRTWRHHPRRHPDTRLEARPPLVDSDERTLRGEVAHPGRFTRRFRVVRGCLRAGTEQLETW